MKKCKRVCIMENITIKDKEFEIKKSIDDPIYFINNFVKIKHPVRGIIPFRLYKYQETLISEMARNSHLVINKSRQMGCSNVSYALCLWYVMFHETKNVLIINTKRSASRDAHENIMFMHNNLPDHFKYFNPTIENNLKNDLEIKFESTDSKILLADGMDISSWRAVDFSWLFVDESAFIENMKTILDQLLPMSLLSGRRFTMFSTPNGKINKDGSENVFFDVYSNSKNGVGPFFAMDLPWYLDPEKDDKWMDKLCLFPNKKMFNQEYNLSFM